MPQSLKTLFYARHSGYSRRSEAPGWFGDILLPPYFNATMPDRPELLSILEQHPLPSNPVMREFSRPLTSATLSESLGSPFLILSLGGTRASWRIHANVCRSAVLAGGAWELTLYAHLWTSWNAPRKADLLSGRFVESFARWAAWYKNDGTVRKPALLHWVKAPEPSVDWCADLLSTLETGGHCRG